jgi:hypothetical protein
MIANGAPDATREDERRLRRAAWPVRRFRLGEEPSEDLSASTTVEDRIAMMWPLAVDAFSHGRGVPDRTPRDLWPVRVRRLGDPEVD